MRTLGLRVHPVCTDSVLPPPPLFVCAGNVSSGCTLHGKAESSMQNPSALFGMVSHCQTPTFTDFSSLSLAVYGSKADICARRATFGSQTCRSSPDAATFMNRASPKRLIASEEKAHLQAKAPRSCLPLPLVQGRRRGCKRRARVRNGFIDSVGLIEGCTNWRDFRTSRLDRPNF